MGIAVQSATASLHRISVSELPPARPLSLGLWTTAACAARTLLEAGAGEALVLDDGRPLGVVTTRGLSRVLASHMDQAPHFAVRDVMADRWSAGPHRSNRPAPRGGSIWAGWPYATATSANCWPGWDGNSWPPSPGRSRRSTRPSTTLIWPCANA